MGMGNSFYGPLRKHHWRVTIHWEVLKAADIKHTLDQWFSTFFSTGPHYGPRVSLTGRTRVIYILHHQYKPTRFIILFIA